MRARGFFGWRMVGAASVLAAFAWGIGFYGPPVFPQVLHAGRGWPVAAVSGAVTGHFPVGAAVVADLADLHRRFGLVAVTRAVAPFTAASQAGYAFAPGRLRAAARARRRLGHPAVRRRRPAATRLGRGGAGQAATPGPSGVTAGRRSRRPPAGSGWSPPSATADRMHGML